MLNFGDHIEVKTLCFKNLVFDIEEGVRVFNDLTFDFPVNHVVWVKGKSGSGLSTLLQLQAGLLSPQSGSYFINDMNISDLSFEEFAPLRLNIGYSFEIGGLISNQTLMQNLLLPFIYHKILDLESAEQRIKELLDLFNIYEFRQSRPAMVSGSVKKACCVIRSLMLRPQILLLDNPTAGLSEGVRKNLIQYILHQRKLGNLKHIFIVSYDEDFMSNFSALEIEIKDPQTIVNFSLKKAG